MKTAWQPSRSFLSWVQAAPGPPLGDERQERGRARCPGLRQPPPTAPLGCAAEPGRWEESASADDAGSKLEKAVCLPIYKNLNSLFFPLCMCVSTQIACMPIKHSLEFLFAVHLQLSFKKLTHKWPVPWIKYFPAPRQRISPSCTPHPNHH